MAKKIHTMGKKLETSISVDLPIAATQIHEYKATQPTNGNNIHIRKPTKKEKKRFS